MANDKDFKVKNGIQPTVYHEGVGTVVSGSEGYSLAGASYDSVDFSVQTQETTPQGVEFKTDGTIMYIVGLSNNTIYQYTLSTGWDLSTASYASKSFSVNTQATDPYEVRFKSDGTKMYVVDDTANKVFQYALSTPWDVSTASYNSVEFSVGSQSSAPVGIVFNSSGTSMYITDYDGPVYQYTLSTAWDLSTASYASKSLDTSGDVGGTYGIAFNSDGTKLFAVGISNDIVGRYSLTTAYDISTASFDSITFSVASQDNTPRGFVFKSDGTKMYVIGTQNDKVYQYSTVQTTNTLDLSTGSVFEITPTSDIQVTLSNPADSGTVSGATLLLDGAASDGWDIGNAVSTGKTFATTSQDTFPGDVVFNTDGTKMYTVGRQNDSIYQYSLSTAYDPSTATYDSKSMSVSSEDSNPRSFCFADSGTKVYMAGDTTDSIYQYNLTTAYDISTGSYASKSLSVSSQDTAIRGVRIKADGTSIYLNGTNSFSIYQYNLTTAYDLSTASYASKSFNFSSQDLNSRGFFFKYDGTKMYIHGSDGDDISSYSLSTAWDVSTASFDSVAVSVATGVCGVNASDDGVYLYTVDEDDDTINQYSMGVGATITYPSTVEFSGGTAPTSPAIGETDVITFSTTDGGTSYQAVQAIDGAK